MNACELEKSIEIFSTEPLQLQVENALLSCDVQSVVLEPTILSGSFPNIEWLWPNGSTASSLEVENPGIYLLQADDGCEVQEYIFQVEWANDLFGKNPIYIPNSFSPNHDGINDEFRIFQNNDFTIKTYECKIFDRWGDMVFGSTDPAIGWDGRFRKQQMQTGIYIWYVKAVLEYCDGREVDFYEEGELVIIR